MWLLHFYSLEVYKVLPVSNYNLYNNIVINNMTKKFNIYPVKYRFKKAAVNCLDLQMIVKMVTCHPIPIITFSLLLYVIYT